MVSKRLDLHVAAFAAFSAAAVLVEAPSAHADGFSSAPINFKVGGFVAVVPKFEGSDEYEVIGFPMIAPSGSIGDGRVQFRGPDDLRFRLLDFSGFEAGALVGWRFDREEDDSDRLRGLGDVDGGVLVGGFVAYRAGWLKPFVSFNHQVSGDDAGALVRFGAESTQRVSEHLSLTALVGANWASDDFMDAYFSISPTQSANSEAGLGVYDADAGIKDVHLGLSADLDLTDRWTLKIGGRYTRLVGDAADSPIVESEDQFMGGLGFTYRLGN